MAEPDTKRPPGRPRSEEKRQAILRATVELLERHGFTGVSVDAIAEHAGVGKATIYRWWPNKATVTMDAIFSIIDRLIPEAEADSSREDLTRHLRHLIRLLGDARTGGMIAAVYAEAVHDPELVAVVQERVQSPRRAAAKQILEAGIASGELRPGLQFDAVLDLMYGPIYYRFLVTHEPTPASYADTLIEHIWPQISAPPRRRKRRAASSSQPTRRRAAS
jgi:AcrR family transcriptional regulator